MRPNPTQHNDTESGRIIYLGDVRRRRTSRKRQAPDRHYLFVIGLIAIAAWGVWVTVLLTLPPAKLLTYVIFFAPMFVAVTATGAVVAYAVDWRRGYFPELRTCLRRGALASMVVVVNLATLASHHWAIPLLGVTVVGAVLADIGIAARER